MQNEVLQQFSVENRVVAVTGGCGGIGQGLVKGLLKAGARVAILDTNEEKAAAVCAALKDEVGGELRSYVANITDEQSVETVFAAIERDFGRVDGLINCAGITCVKPLGTMPMDRWSAVMDVNLKGTVICSKVAGRYMYKNRWGRIVNISSLGATHGKPGYTAYTPSKAAVNAFTFTLAAEWAKLGINVNAVSPVIVVTDINRKQVENTPGYLENVVASIPQARVCSPELLMGTVQFLLSEASSYVTGQIIGCDGGAEHGDVSVLKPYETMEG